MTKIRPSLTVEAALDRAVGILTREEVADIIGKTTATTYAYGDPDNDKHLPLRDAMALDAECIAATGEAPFFAMQRVVLEAGNFRGRANLAEALLEVHAGAVRLRDLVQAARAAQSPGGKRITMQEAASIHGITDQLLTIVHGIRSSVSAGVAREDIA